MPGLDGLAAADDGTVFHAGRVAHVDPTRATHRGRSGTSVDHTEYPWCQGMTDSVRSIWVLLPWRSRTETFRRPLDSAAMGFCKRSSQRLPGSAWNFVARFSPGLTPSIAKSAVTDRLARSSPVA